MWLGSAGAILSAKDYLAVCAVAAEEAKDTFCFQTSYFVVIRDAGVPIVRGLKVGKNSFIELTSFQASIGVLRAAVSTPRCPANSPANGFVSPVSCRDTLPCRPMNNESPRDAGADFEIGGQMTPVSLPLIKFGGGPASDNSFICTGYETPNTALDIIPSATAYATLAPMKNGIPTRVLQMVFFARPMVMVP